VRCARFAGRGDRSGCSGGAHLGARGHRGAAFGPAAGGILTQLLGWESIFVVQAPLILATLLALVGMRAAPALQPLERPHVAANAALMLVSGARSRASRRMTSISLWKMA
jgi:MFS family permease